MASAFQGDAFQSDAFQSSTDLSGSDTGSGTDAATLAAALSASDTGAAVDDASVDDGALPVDKNDSDTGSGADTAALAAAQSASDTGTATEGLSKEIDGVVSETGSGADAATMASSRQTGDVGVAADSAFVDAPTPGDTGSATESAHVTKFDDAALLVAASASAATEGVQPADTRILYDGVDITGLVIFEQTKFKSQANGGVGSATVRVKDVSHGLSFTEGVPLELWIEGVRDWNGFVSKVRRGYFFVGTVATPENTVRYFELSGFDLNVFFQKRVLYDKDTPTRMQLSTFDPGTTDQEIIKAYINRHTDMRHDGIELDLVEVVGTPSTDSPISGAASWQVGQLLRMLRFNTGAIDYIDPDRNLVHTDVDTPSSVYGISDVPDTEGYSDLFTRTVPVGFGGAFTNLLDSSSGEAAASVDGSVARVAPNEYVQYASPLPDAVRNGVIQFDFWVPADPAELFSFYEVDSGLIPIDYPAPGGPYYNMFGIFVYPSGDDAVWNVNGWSGFTTIAVEPGNWYTAQALYDVDAGIIGTGTQETRVWKRGDQVPLSPLEGEFPFGAILIDSPESFPPSVWIGSPEFEPAGLDNLLLSGRFIGVREFEIEFDGERLRNDALTWGMGGGSPTPVFKRAISQESIDEHGLWQVSRVVPGIWKQATIDHVAHVLVHGSPQSKRGGKDDAVAVQCVTFRHGFRVAQKVPVESQVWGYSDVLPIRVMEIDFPSKNPRYKLTLSHEIDDPWSSFDPFRFDFDVPNIDINVPNIDIDIPPFVLPPFGGGDGCDGLCWSTPIDIEILFRMHRVDTEDPMSLLLQVSQTANVPGGDNVGSILFNFQGGDATNTLYADVDANSSGVGSGSANMPVFGSADNVWIRGRFQILDSLVRAKAWVDGASEPAGWIANAGAAVDPHRLGYLMLNLQTGETSGTYIEIGEMRVRGYGDGLLLETFSRVEENGWGISEIMGAQWVTETFPTVLVDGEKARFYETNDAADFILELLCDVEFEARCAETFSRSTAGGWGASELMCDLTWQHTESGTFAVDGEDGIIEGGDGEGASTWLHMPDEWDTSPVDFVAKISTTQDSATFATSSGVGFAILYAANPDEDDGTTPDGFSNTIFRFTVIRRSDGTVRAQINYLVAADSFDLSGISTSIPFWVRCRIESGQATMAIWKVDDPEPAPQVALAITNALSIVNNGATGGSGPANVFQAYKLINEQATFTISNITFDSGLSCDCGTPDCLDEFPPIGDPPLGMVGEIPIRIDTPEGQDPDNFYFRTLSNFNLGSTRVTVNDTFLRLGVDYFEHDPYGDHYIEIDDSVDIPDDSAIWVTYTANAGSFVVPGIVGWGSGTTGGTGGRVINCYNFADLRAALEASGPRIIMLLGSAVFDGNGAAVDVHNGDVTVDGKLWTGSMKSYKIVFRCSNVIITEVAWRPGEGATPGESADSRAISFNPGNEGGTLSNIVLRKSSFAWGPDVVLSFINSCTNFTVQECLLGPALFESNIPDGGPGKKGYGPNVTVPGNSDPTLMWGKRGTFYRNLYAFNRQRNLKYEHSQWIDAINNVVYGWGSQAPLYGNARGENVVSNIFKKSPDTQASNDAFEEDGSGDYPQYPDSTYHSGNIGLQADGTPFTLDWSRIDGSALLASPYGGELHNVTAATADGALFASVVANAGRTYQDPIDIDTKARVIAGTSLGGNGFYNGAGYPAPHPSW